MSAIAVRHTCRSELAREAFLARPSDCTFNGAPPVSVYVGWKTAKHFPPVGAQAAMYGATLSSARATGFALHGDSLFSVAGRPAPKKVSKNACPYIRVSLRETALTPPALRGPAYKGHPWPFTPLAASMPLAPLHTDSVRPSERGDSVASAGPCSKSFVWLRRRVGNAKLTHRSCRASFDGRADCGGKCFAVFHPTSLQATRSLIPFRRPSAGVAQGGSRHGCRERSDGTWMSLRDDPRSNAGAREVLRSKTRMQGWPSFWLLFLGQTRKSDAPCKAQPVVHAEESAAVHMSGSASTASRARTRRPPALLRKQKQKQKHAASFSGEHGFTCQVPKC